MTAKIVAGYVSNHTVLVNDLASLIETVHKGLKASISPPPPQPSELLPAVPVKKSITPDYIVCLEDGKKLKMLKRHLMTSYGLTPDAYRTKWGLPPSYPMVAPNYARIRSEVAVKVGLGRRPSE